MYTNIKNAVSLTSIYVALFAFGQKVYAATGATNLDGGGSQSIINPLKSQSISEFLLKIIDVLLIFALPIIILYIMYAGYLFVTAAGNSEQVSSAKKALLWAVVGGVIVLGAKIIIGVIQGTVTAF